MTRGDQEILNEMDSAIRQIETLTAWQALEQSESELGSLSLCLHNHTQRDLDVEIGRFWQWAKKFPQQSGDKRRAQPKPYQTRYMALIRKFYQLIAQRTF